MSYNEARERIFMSKIMKKIKTVVQNDDVQFCAMIAAATISALGVGAVASYAGAKRAIGESYVIQINYTDKDRNTITLH
jgi:hypothetical protein